MLEIIVLQRDIDPNISSMSTFYAENICMFRILCQTKIPINEKSVLSQMNAVCLKLFLMYNAIVTQ